ALRVVDGDFQRVRRAVEVRISRIKFDALRTTTDCPARCVHLEIVLRVVLLELTATCASRHFGSEKLCHRSRQVLRDAKGVVCEVLVKSSSGACTRHKE